MENQQINTQGGAVVLGDVNAELFVGRDLLLYQQITYQQITPRGIDETTLAAAQYKLAQLPLDTIPPIATLPPGSRIPYSVNPLFVGREPELRTLAAHLKGGATIAIGQIAASTGLGGIGKTQLAAAFAHHYGQFFAGGVQWLSFADPQSVPAEIAACGAMMPDLRADYATLDLESQIRLVLAAWQSPLPRLLVFDNCEDPTLLAKWRPPTGGSRVLVTSRRRTWAAGLGVTVLPLDTLTRAQSLLLLHKFPAAQNTPPFTPAEEPVLAAIADELGDLPLALHLAGSYLAHYRHGVAPEHYLAQLRQPDLLTHRSLIVSDLSPQADELSPTKHLQHVARTFAVGYERLHPANPIDALAQSLLARAAWFAPGQPIPRALLLASSELTEGEEATLQAADALVQLVNLGLLEATSAGDLLVHRLIVYFVQGLDTMRSQEAQRAVATTFLEAFNRLHDVGTLPESFLAWKGHLRYITDLVQGQTDERAADLCHLLASLLHTIGDYAGARPYTERALAIVEELSGAKHPNTARRLNNLGMQLLVEGDYVAARPYYERSLAIYEEVLGAEHPDTVPILNNLGAVLQAQGEYKTAQSYYERALAICEKETKHPDTAFSLNNLGGVMRAQGDHTAARLYYERALTIHEEVLGTKHPYTAQSVNYLGTLLLEEGDYVAAWPYLERTLVIYEEALGTKHPNTASSLNSLGMLLYAMGQYEAARPYLERTLAIREEVLGSKHPHTAWSLNDLGGLLQEMGEYGAAQPYLEQSLAIREEVLGSKHPDTAMSLYFLGRLLQEMGEYGVARPYYERALAIREEVLGAKHPLTQTVRRNLAALQKALPS